MVVVRRHDTEGHVKSLLPFATVPDDEELIPYLQEELGKGFTWIPPDRYCEKGNKRSVTLQKQSAEKNFPKNGSPWAVSSVSGVSSCW